MNVPFGSSSGLSSRSDLLCKPPRVTRPARTPLSSSEREDMNQALHRSEVPPGGDPANFLSAYALQASARSTELRISFPCSSIVGCLAGPRFFPPPRRWRYPKTARPSGERTLGAPGACRSGTALVSGTDECYADSGRRVSGFWLSASDEVSRRTQGTEREAEVSPLSASVKKFVDYRTLGHLMAEYQSRRTR